MKRRRMMAMIKGQKEFEKFKAGERLTWKEAVLALCYICNGGPEGGVDCRGTSCPLYSKMPYRARQGA